MPEETQRAAILRVLAEQDGWVTRQELIRLTGHPKGYAEIIGNSLRASGPSTLAGLGLVAIERVAGEVRYRVIKSAPANVIALGKASTDLTNWEKALEALIALGGRATRLQIREWLISKYGAFSMENVRKDLTMLSVNDKGRFAYRAWEVRHGRPKVALDHVYAGAGSGANRIYEIYDPDLHGVWEIFRQPSGALDLRQALTIQDDELRDQQQQTPEYDPSSPADGKRRILREIAARLGAPKFRKAILVAFARTCCISSCGIVEILEAAHIRPYDGPNTNHVSNGLLLRSDLHTLFDLGLIRVSSDFEISMHPRLKAHPEYSRYDGKKLIKSSPRPSGKALADHWERHELKWVVATD